MKSWRTSCTRPPEHKKSILVLLALIVILAAVLSLCLGAAALTPGDMLAVLTGRQTGTAAARILLYVRLPRTAACLLAGGALAVSGAVIQGVLANSLAAPNIIGVNAGAGLMVVLCCALVPTAAALTPYAAFAGALLGVLLVLFISEKSGASKMTLVLAGVAMSSLFSAGIDTVLTLVPDALMGYSDFRIGGFSGVSMARVAPAFWVVLVSLVAVFSLCNELDVLMLGTETAQTLGLPARRLRIVLLALAAALSGAAVSFSGLLGFVGLIVPHIMRRLVGEESRVLLPAVLLGGAGLVTLCDLLARVLFAPYELPVGIVLSLVGGPFFLWLLLTKRGGKLHG